jgi:hypothetical protein
LKVDGVGTQSLEKNLPNDSKKGRDIVINQARKSSQPALSSNIRINLSN